MSHKYWLKHVCNILNSRFWLDKITIFDRKCVFRIPLLRITSRPDDDMHSRVFACRHELTWTISRMKNLEYFDSKIVETALNRPLPYFWGLSGWAYGQLPVSKNVRNEHKSRIIHPNTWKRPYSTWNRLKMTHFKSIISFKGYFRTKYEKRLFSKWAIFENGIFSNEKWKNSISKSKFRRKSKKGEFWE